MRRYGNPDCDHSRFFELEAMRVFAYLTADKAPLYREIMRVFAEFKERFVFDLRPQDIVEAVENSEQAEIEAALAELCEWGNLEAHPETADANSLEDFYTQRNVFRITIQGEAAERSLQSFESRCDAPPPLQASALHDVRYALEKLGHLSRETDPDSGEIHRSLLVLVARFHDFRGSAQSVIAALEQRSDLRGLIDMGEGFVAELVLATDEIDKGVRDIEEAGVERLVQAASDRGMPDVQAQWKRFRDWFISGPDGPSNAEVLRSRARESLRILLSLVTSINDQQIERIDRSNEFRILARRFAESASDAEAHRLWRAAFGLGPARHFSVDDATLDLYESIAEPDRTSWLEAPPLQASVRHPQTGGMTRLVDRTQEKQKLAAATREETLRILTAQARFATGRRMRLSELQHLEADEFDLLLDVLGETDNENFHVKIEPASALDNGADGENGESGEEAFITTAHGVLSGPDLWITIERTSSEEIQV
jgi:uncharacterized protein (TIGR02677 family)